MTEGCIYQALKCNMVLVLTQNEKTTKNNKKPCLSNDYCKVDSFILKVDPITVENE